MNQLDTEDTDAGAWTAERHVTSLYQAHALGLARLGCSCWATRRPPRTSCRTRSSACTAAGTAWPTPPPPSIAFPTLGAVRLPHSKQFEARQTVRSLNLKSQGGNLMTDSQVIWSQSTASPSGDFAKISAPTEQPVPVGVVSPSWTHWTQISTPQGTIAARRAVTPKPRRR